MASLRVPDVVPSPSDDCQRLKKAFEGWGTDEKAVIWILGHRNACQRKQIRDAYHQLYNKSLLDDLHSELSSHFRKAITWWMVDPSERDARLAKEALQTKRKGIKHLLPIIEIACASQPQHLIAVRQAYCSLFDSSLEEDILETLPAPFRKLVAGLVRCFRYDKELVDLEVAKSEAALLREAIEKKQLYHDDRVLRILTTRNFSQLRATFHSYKGDYGTPFDEDADKYGNGDLESLVKAVVLCIETPEKHFAEVLRTAMAGLGTDEESLSRGIVTRAEIDLMKIRGEYLNMYQISLENDVKGDTSGDYKDFLLTLLGAKIGVEHNIWIDDKSLFVLVSELRVSIDWVISLSKDHHSDGGGTLSEFTFLVEKFTPVVNHLTALGEEAKDLIPVKKAVQFLAKEFLRARNLLKQAHSRYSARKIEDLTHDLGRSLGLVLFAGVGFSSEARQKIRALYRELMSTSFETSQVTSLRTSTSSHSGYCSESETEEAVEEREIIEEEKILLDVDEVALQLKHGDEEELRHALLVLRDLIHCGHASREWIENQGLVYVLCNRLSSGEGNNRLIVLRILRALASDENVVIKDKMAEATSLSAMVGSLSKDVEESREAVGVLLSLSNLPAARRRLGKIQGCIVTLAAILHGEDTVAASDASKLLNALSSNTQNALYMAEAGYFKPLVQYLKEGSEMSKILMASAVCRMELTDLHKSALGEDGAINPLASMLNAGKLEAKLCSLSALQKLLSLTENVRRLVNSGIVGYLLQLLFSVTSVLMTLREPVSAILARIAECESLLVNQRVAQQMLSLLNLSSPKIQNHLLHALNNISSHPSASKVRRNMKENSAIQLILPFIAENNSKIRINALKLLHTLSQDSGNELGEQLGEYHMHNLLDIISSTTSKSERATVVGILGNLPPNDKKATEIMRKSNLLPTLLSALTSASETTISADCGECSIEECVARVLIRFTNPSDKKLQLYAVKNGVIPPLVKLLSSGTPLASSSAATSLAQLSQNTVSLGKSRKSRWSCILAPSVAYCDVHDRCCVNRSTFCLVKAGAVAPLIENLDSEERQSDEGVLEALATLVQDEFWENGCNYLAKMSAIPAIIKVAESGSAEAREKASLILEKMFRIDEYKRQYAQSSQAISNDSD